MGEGQVVVWDVTVTCPLAESYMYIDSLTEPLMSQVQQQRWQLPARMEKYADLGAR